MAARDEPAAAADRHRGAARHRARPAARSPASAVHDIDDVQQIVERNACGREAEARRAERILEAELDRFERWLGSLEVVPTIAALRERGDEIVRRVLAENEGRWESLSEADRERLEAMAKAIATPPPARADPAAASARPAATTPTSTCSALRELFGLDVETERRRPRREAPSVTDAAPPGRKRLRAAWRCGSAPGAARSRSRRRRRSPSCSAAPSWSRSSSDGEPGDKSRFVRGVERALLDGRGRPRRALRQGPAGRDAGGARDRRRCRRARTRPTPGSAPAASLDDVPEGARVGTASLRRRAQLLAARPDLEVVRAARQRRHPAAQARRGRARRDRPRRRRACAGSGARTRSRFALRPRQMTPAPGQGALALEAARR